jgi:hypothetical protein
LSSIDAAIVACMVLGARCSTHRRHRRATSERAVDSLTFILVGADASRSDVYFTWRALGTAAHFGMVAKTEIIATIFRIICAYPLTQSKTDVGCSRHE